MQLLYIVAAENQQNKIKETAESESLSVSHVHAVVHNTCKITEGKSCWLSTGE